MQKMSKGKVITVTLSEETWRELKKRAVLSGKSISAFVRERIEEELGQKRNIYEEIHKELEKIAQKVGGRLGKWNREELYDL